MTHPFDITIAGLVPFTSIDFPDRLAGVVFLQGCPLRCPFCHNPNLQTCCKTFEFSGEELESFLKTHQKRLDGIVLSGGEPLLQADIVAFAKWINSFGYQVGLHTSGVYPDRLQALLPILDWVGLDVKAPWCKYNVITGSRGMARYVEQSLKILSENSVPFEVRTTCDPRYLEPNDIYQLVDDLKPYNIKTYALQHYRTFDADKNPPSNTQIESFFSDEILIEFLKNRFSTFLVR